MDSIVTLIKDDSVLNILVIISTFGMLIASKTLGKTTGDISRKFNLRVTPPGIFFAIWGVIYLGLIIAAVYAVMGEGWSVKMKILFSIGNVLNGLWLFVFGLNSTKTNNICFLILLGMAVTNQILWFQSVQVSKESGWNIAICNIIAFYQGWLVVASNLNLGVVLVYSLGMSKNDHVKFFYSLTSLAVLGMVTLNLSTPRGFHNNIAMYVTAIYGLIGSWISYRKEQISDVSLEKEKNK